MTGACRTAQCKGIPLLRPGNSASCRLHRRQHCSQCLFINALVDAKPTPILEDQLNAGFAGAWIVADQRKTRVCVHAWPMQPSWAAAVPVEFALPPVELALFQPALPTKFANREFAAYRITYCLLPETLFLHVLLFRFHEYPQAFGLQVHTSHTFSMRGSITSEAYERKMGLPDGYGLCQGFPTKPIRGRRWMLSIVR